MQNDVGIHHINMLDYESEENLKTWTWRLIHIMLNVIFYAFQLEIVNLTFLCFMCKML